MAKKDKTDYGSFDFEGLDFDFQDTPNIKSSKGKSKKPIDHVVDGVKDSMRTKFTDPSHIRGMIRKALPEGFSQAWDAVDQIGVDSARLYDDATKEIRPHIGSIARKLDQLVPESAFRAKKFTRGLKERFGEETINNRFPSSFEEQTTQGVERMFAELDQSREANTEHRHARDTASAAVRDRVEDKKFEVNQKTLGIIANSTLGLRRYMETYDVSWKKKSLELQFRSYAAQTSLLNNFVKYAERNAKFQDSLLLNTSLPEYAKTSNTQRWKQQSKERIIGGVNDSLFGKKSRIGLAGDRLMKMGKEKVDGLRDGMSMFDDALAMALDAKDMDKDMAEMEGRKHSGYRTAGNFGGSMLGDMLSDFASGKMKSFMEKYQKLSKAGFNVGRHALNPGSLIKKAQGSKWFKGLGNSGSSTDESIQSGLTALFNLLAGEKPDMSIQNTSIGGEGEDKLHTQMRQARTINEIIPGYLARILREITVLRTGDDKTSLLTYDGTAGKFKTQTTMSADLMDSFRKQAREGRSGKHTYAEEFEDYYKTFTGGDKLGAKGDKDVRSFLSGISRSSDNFDFTGEGLRDTTEYKALSPSAKKSIDSILNKRFTGDDHATAGNQFRLAQKAASTKGAIGNLTGPIRDAIRDGHADLLEERGLIKRNDKGDWEVNRDQYYDFYDKTATRPKDTSAEVPSDINLKTNIRPMGKSAQAAVNAFKNTGVYDWNYKSGTGYGKETYTGPMAQDVRANFGEDAAPGGKKLDLVNLNGYTMAAVKGLTEKVDQLGGGDGLKYLSEISQYTKIMAERGIGGGEGGEGTGSNRFTGTGIAGNIGALISGLLDTGSKAIGSTANTAVKAGGAVATAASDLWKSNKKDIIELRDKVLAGAMDAAAMASRFGSDLLFNKLPALGQMSKIMAGDAVKSIKGMLQKAQDLYVPGRDSPVIEGALLRAGYYRDKVTGKIITTMDELAKATGDIIDPNGETVLSAMTKARGLVDKTGKSLKSFASAALQGAKTLGMAAIGAGAIAFDKLKAGFGQIKGSGLLGKARDKATALGDKFKGMNLGMNMGFGGSDPRTVPILIQIRDLLAVGKGGKKVAEILGRSIDAVSTKQATKTQANSQETLEENPDKVNTSLMTQVRDLIASDKPADTLKEILGRSSSVRNFLKIPLVGPRVKKFMDKFKNPNISGLATNGASPDFVGPMPDLMGPRQPGVGQPGGSSGGMFGMLSGLGGMFGAAKDAGGALLGAGQEALSNRRNQRSGGKDFVGPVPELVGPRAPSRMDRAKGRFSQLSNSKAGRFLGKGLGRAGGVLGTVASTAGGMLSALSGAGQPGGEAPKPIEEDDHNRYSANVHSARLLQLSGNKAVKAYGRLKGVAFGDGDGDGQRDGGTADRMADAHAARIANEERKQAGIDASMKGAEAKANRNKPADDAIGKMISMATAGLSSIAGMAGSLISGIGGLFGMGSLLGGAGKLAGKVAGGLWGAAKGIGGFLNPGKGAAGRLVAGGKAAGSVAGTVARGGMAVGNAALTAGGFLAKGAMGIGRGLAGIGSGIKGIMGMVPGASKVARVGMGAMRVAQVVGLAAGGGVGMLSGIAAVAGSILTSPLFLGAAAVGAVGYGGYKLYKYLTRNNINDFERIRVMQYGLDGRDATKTYNNKALGLESYLLDGKLAFQNGIPRVNARAAKIDEIYSLFDIDPQVDDGSKEKFDEWYANRFQQVFLHHVALLFRIDKKASLDKIDSLDKDKKLEYISGAEISGVWDYTTSPFKGLDVLSDNPKPCRELITAMTKTLGKALQDKAKESVKAGENKPKGEDAANATKVITSAIPAASTDPTNKAPINEVKQPHNPSKANFGALPANSKAAKYLASINGSVEEGKEPKNQSETMASRGGGGGSVGNLKIAGGPLSSGEAGMQFIKLGKDASIDGLQPRMKQHLLAMAQEYGEATGKSISINEGFRSFQRQDELYRKFGPGRAAKPGTSLHEFGLALDINTPIMNELDEMGLLRKYGFTRPIQGETWHMEPAGIQQAIQRAKKDGSFADAAVLASLGRGGGGFGATPNSHKGGRNPELAMAVYNATGGSKIDLTDKESGMPAGQSNSLNLPMVNGKASGPIDKMRNLAGPSGGTSAPNGMTGPSSEGVSDSPMVAAAGQSYSTAGKGQGVKFSGNNDASASLGDGSGKFDGVKAMIAKHSSEAGADPTRMMLMGAMESSLDPKAGVSGSSAKGLMQFVDDTWNEQAGKHASAYGIDPNDRMNTRSQVILAAKYMDQKKGKLQKAAGRKLEFVDEYMGHMFGAGGASTLLKATPESIAANLLPDAAASNREVFFDRARPRTVAEVRKLLDGRIREKAKDFGIALPDSGSSSNGQSLAGNSNIIPVGAKGTPNGEASPPMVSIDGTKYAVPPPRASSKTEMVTIDGTEYPMPSPKAKDKSEMISIDGEFFPIPSPRAKDKSEMISIDGEFFPMPSPKAGPGSSRSSIETVSGGGTTTTVVGTDKKPTTTTYTPGPGLAGNPGSRSRTSRTSPPVNAGFSLPDTELPMFTKAKADTGTAMVTPSEKDRANRMSPMAMTGGAGTSTDRSMSATTEVFSRLVQGADKQVKHLSSIDDTLAKQIVPLLQQMVDNTAGSKEAGSVDSKGSSQTPSPSKLPSVQAGNRMAQADKSSFDNRRSATTV